MSIFADNQLTPAQKAAQAIIAQAKGDFAMRRARLVQYARQVWKNPTATPQEILAALGTNAAELFAAHAQDAATIAAKDPTIVTELSAIIKPTTVHDDGTVTVN